MVFPPHTHTQSLLRRMLCIFKRCWDVGPTSPQWGPLPPLSWDGAAQVVGTHLLWASRLGPASLSGWKKVSGQAPGIITGNSLQSKLFRKIVPPEMDLKANGNCLMLNNEVSKPRTSQEIIRRLCLFRSLWESPVLPIASQPPVGPGVWGDSCKVRCASQGGGRCIHLQSHLRRDPKV